MKCPKCKSALKFRKWSNRYPAKSEALAVCTGCVEKWQIRYFAGNPSSRPYQVKQPAKKTCRGSYKLSQKRKDAIVMMYGSVQNMLDTASLVSMSLQSKS